MDGGSGNDLLIGGHGIDEISGGSGNDWMRGGANGDDYSGGDGSDTVSYADNMPSADTTTGVDVNLGSGSAITPDGTETLSGVENVLGSAFDDRLQGTGGADGLDGGPGDDKITGGAGADQLNGGPGNDTCDRDSADKVVACGVGTVADNDPRPSTAYVYMDGRGPDPGLYVIGQPGARDDNLVVTATQSALAVVSQAGTAISKLPASTNLCSLLQPAGASCPSPPQAPIGFVTVWGDSGDDHLSLGGNYGDATTVMDGGPGNDVLDGTSGDDVLFSGQSGQDVLNGGDGSDALLALGTGGDKLNGGAGNDQLVTDDVCQGHDYNGGPGYDIAGFARYKYKSGVNATLGGSAFDPSRGNCAPTKLGSDLEILEGSNGSDNLTGTNGKDALILGRGGDDVINGMGGADTIDGGAGNDTLLGGGGFDTLESKDGTRDKSVNCGSGGGQAYRDNSDPVTGCKKLKASKRKRKGR
jgi:Ca2+-binding RTX toxin-like protein